MPPSVCRHNNYVQPPFLALLYAFGDFTWYVFLLRKLFFLVAKTCFWKTTFSLRPMSFSLLNFVCLFFNSELIFSVHARWCFTLPFYYVLHYPLTTRASSYRQGETKTRAFHTCSKLIFFPSMNTCMCSYCLEEICMYMCELFLKKSVCFFFIFNQIRQQRRTLFYMIGRQKSICC